MKILYALQKTGNGHIARAQELIPILKKYADVDILTSGTQSQLNLPFHVKYSCSGLSLFYDQTGALSYSMILKKNHYLRFIRDVFTIPIHRYNLIINDFEPVTAWASILRKGSLVALSHQASLWFKETPTPLQKNLLASLIIRYYAPAKHKYGFHFSSYHKNIFPPIIRNKIRILSTSTSDRYVVYLPSYADTILQEILELIPTEWHIFSRYTSSVYQNKNCTFHPINESSFLHYLSCCKGVLCNAGFELPSESLFLDKKLFVIPIKNQLEQAYNAKALSLMGIKTASKPTLETIQDWVNNEDRVKVNFPDLSDSIIRKVLSLYC